MRCAYYALRSCRGDLLLETHHLLYRSPGCRPADRRCDELAIETLRRELNHRPRQHAVVKALADAANQHGNSSVVHSYLHYKQLSAPIPPPSTAPSRID